VSEQYRVRADGVSETATNVAKVSRIVWTIRFPHVPDAAAMIQAGWTPGLPPADEIPAR
jgi:hypothetical protein